MPKTETETYLGDGLYASHDGYQIKLRAPRFDGDHEIFMDELVMREFMNFAKSLHTTKKGDQ